MKIIFRIFHIKSEILVLQESYFKNVRLEVWWFCVFAVWFFNQNQFVVPTGFEPVTPPWKGGDLNHLSTGRLRKSQNIFIIYE